jgi:hypothetical protein
MDMICGAPPHTPNLENELYGAFGREKMPRKIGEVLRPNIVTHYCARGGGERTAGVGLTPQ